MSSLKSILDHLPHAPGVYRFLDAAGGLLYVGKAIDLKKRVGSYFRKDPNRSLRLQKLAEKTADIQFTVVGSELEALILETNLIKSLRPRYNILMKDDKNYVYLKITVAEEYPRVLIVRTVENDGSRYFGPKSSASQLRTILDALKKIFPYRHCPLFIQLKEKAVFNVKDHVKRCFGVCSRSVSPSEYRRAIDQVVAFFEGHVERIEADLKAEMGEAVAAKKFEAAVLLRDRLAAIHSITETQRISAPDFSNRDVIGLVVEGGGAYAAVLTFRSGKLVGQDNFELNAVDAVSGAELDGEEVLSAFLRQYYEKVTEFPAEVFVPFEFSECALIEEWVHSLSRHKVRFHVPQRGPGRELMELAQSNVVSFAKQSHVRWYSGTGHSAEEAMKSLKDLLDLPRLPKRIECYDISHLGGTDTVGSMVVFEKGFSKPSDYRHFKLRTLEERVDDFKAMGEVLTRRLKYLQTPPAELRKPRKADLPLIREMLAAAGFSEMSLNLHRTLMFEREGKVGAIGSLRPRGEDPLVSELSVLWSDPAVAPEGVEAEVVRWLLAKQKKGKVFVFLPEGKRADFFGALGFHSVEKTEGGEWMVYRFLKEVEDASFKACPDVLVIDGGRGQLNAVVQVLLDLGLEIPVIGLAKREEEIYVPSLAEPLLLPLESPALRLVQRARDDAHRFALKFQRALRSKRLLS